MNSSPLELVKQKFVKDINRIFKCYPIILRYPWGIVSRIPSVTENLVAFTYNLHTSSHISSVQFSRSVMSDSAIPWNAARQASLSFTNSQSLLKLMSINYVMPPNHLIVLSCLQYFPASESFLMSQLFTSDGQSTEVSASASVLPMSIQNWFPLGWTGNQCSHGWRKLVGYSPFHHDCQLLFFSATVELKLKRLD